jgi:signal transduction histidine kinase
MQTVTLASSLFVVAIAVAFSVWNNWRVNAHLEEKKKEMDRKMYELAILKELGERVGYSLNVQKIIDVITGSLSQFIEYSAVSYMLIEPEKVIFKVHLEGSVSRDFVDNIRNRMLRSLSALLNKEFSKDQVEETLSGAILVDELESSVQSFFNIPLVIGNKVVGVLTVAHVKDGLYKEEEMTILYKITNQASQAVTKLQEVVETEQQKLNAMVESMNEGVVMTDMDYRILVANPVVRKSLCIEEKKDITIFDFIDNLEGKFDIRGKLEESVKLDKILVTNEVLIKDKFFQIIVSPVKSNFGILSGKILGGVVIFHDITHEKELEKMKEDFTSMMVHELRSPLDGIKKIAELIKLRGDKITPEKHNEYTSMINDASSQMLNLVNDLLDVAKLESGKFQLFAEPNNIKTVIEERINFYGSLAKDSNINLEMQFGKNLPEMVKFDKTRVNQIFNNLLSNAIKFTQESEKIVAQAILHQKGKDIREEGKEAGLSWFLEKEEKGLANIPDSLFIAVTDSGIGISKGNIPKLFNKFKQFGAVKDAVGKKGTGLGLVVSKGITEAHGGIIGVASEEGQGSTFYFTLPII